MKKILLLLCFISCVSYSQDKVATIDYTVDYVTYNHKQEAKDTISIGFDKTGRYLWTNSQVLAKELTQGALRRNRLPFENATVNLIYDSKDNAFTVYIAAGKNVFFFNLDVASLVNKRNQNKAETNNTWELKSELIEDHIEVNDRAAELYAVFPSDKEDDKLNVAVDKTLSVNNTQLLKSIFKMIAQEDNAALININLPDGLVLKASNKGETLMEAIKVNETKKTITINNSFTISE